MGFGDGSGIRWTICKQSAPCSRQMTTPTPHHSIFTGRMLFLAPNQQCQSTVGNICSILETSVVCYNSWDNRISSVSYRTNTVMHLCTISSIPTILYQCNTYVLQKYPILQTFSQDLHVICLASLPHICHLHSRHAIVISHFYALFLEAECTSNLQKQTYL